MSKRKTLLCLIEVPDDSCAKPDAVMGKRLPLNGVCRFVDIDELMLAYMAMPMNRGFAHNFDDFIRETVFGEAAGEGK